MLQTDLRVLYDSDSIRSSALRTKVCGWGLCCSGSTDCNSGIRDETPDHSSSLALWDQETWAPSQKSIPWEGLGGSLKSQSCSVVPELVCRGMTGNCLTCCDSFALRQRWSRRRWMEAQLHKPNWFKWLFKIQSISRTFMLDKEAGALRSRNTILNGIMNRSISKNIKKNGMSPPEVLKYAPHTDWGPVLVDLMLVTLSHLCFQYNYCDETGKKQGIFLFWTFFHFHFWEVYPAQKFSEKERALFLVHSSSWWSLRHSMNSYCCGHQSQISQNVCSCFGESEKDNHQKQCRK